jgi:hypothetical protein
MSLHPDCSEELLELLRDRLRHALQYAEAARETTAEALALLEAAKKEEVENDA